MFTLANPWFLLALVLPLLIRRLLPPYREERLAVRSPWFSRLVDFVGGTPETGAVVRRRSTVQAGLQIACWCLIVLALARPQFLEPPIEKTVPMRDLLLAVDLSGSMETEDFTNAAGDRVTRLHAVKEVLADFLKRRDGDRVGLIVFGNAAFVQVPFTGDLKTVQLLLDEVRVGMAGPKTAFGDAIGLGITLFQQSKAKDRVMIALTDGNDTGSQVPPEEASRIAADNNIRIYTVAVGDPSAVGEEKLDEETLKTVAQTTGGKYYYAGDRKQLAQIYDELDRLEPRQVETLSHRPRQDLFQWPLGLALMLALISEGSKLLAGRSHKRHEQAAVTDSQPNLKEAA